VNRSGLTITQSGETPITSLGNTPSSIEVNLSPESIYSLPVFFRYVEDIPFSSKNMMGLGQTSRRY
jgi:hypothetical protein